MPREVTPLQAAVYLALFTGGGSTLFQHPQARPVALMYAALTFGGLLLSVPFWHALGLL